MIKGAGDCHQADVGATLAKLGLTLTEQWTLLSKQNLFLHHCKPSVLTTYINPEMRHYH